MRVWTDRATKAIIELDSLEYQTKLAELFASFGALLQAALGMSISPSMLTLSIEHEGPEEAPQKVRVTWRHGHLVGALQLNPPQSPPQASGLTCCET